MLWEVPRSQAGRTRHNLGLGGNGGKETMLEVHSWRQACHQTVQIVLDGSVTGRKSLCKVQTKRLQRLHTGGHLSPEQRKRASFLSPGISNYTVPLSKFPPHWPLDWSLITHILKPCPWVSLFSARGPPGCLLDVGRNNGCLAACSNSPCCPGEDGEFQGSHIMKQINSQGF